MEIETLNQFLVGSQGDRIVIMGRIRPLSYDEALNLAAYLVSMADGMGTHKFEDVLKAVQNS